jgi:hypothetical protein
MVKGTGINPQFHLRFLHLVQALRPYGCRQMTISGGFMAGYQRSGARVSARR